MTNAEIQVGEYVRFKDGDITKVTEYAKGYLETLEKEIKSHSFNILDLIEVGDYVNGSKVLSKYTNFYNGKASLELDNSQKLGIDFEDIQTIVTKEQMEAIQYVV